MTEEEKKAIGQCNLLLNGEITLHIIDDDGGTAYYGVVNKDYNKDLEIVLNLTQKQDKIIKNQSYTNKKMKKKLDNYRKLTKFKERTIQKQDTEINKLNNVIDRMAEELSNYAMDSYSCSKWCKLDDCNNWSNGYCIENDLSCIKEYFMKEDK